MREQITGIRVIRAFVRDTHERERFAGANADLMTVAVGVGRMMALIFPTVFLVINVSSVAVLWFGGHRIDQGPMLVGSLVAFLSYLMQILMAVMMAVMMFMLVPRVEPITVLPGRGHLELRDVGFSYPRATDPVLRGVSFVAAPGETTAIIGSTGSGKTTLLQTIPRLYDVTEGAVLVDGVDVRELGLDTLWGAIGLVPQKPYLFSGTVASNLRYGKEDATDDEVWHAPVSYTHLRAHETRHDLVCR